MARMVKIAAVKMWSRPLERPHPPEGDAHTFMIEETRGLLDRLSGYGLDLVVTPECIEAIGQDIETAETVDTPGPYLETYIDFARRQSCHVAGSCKIREGEHVYNSMALIGPSGDVLGCYYKTFLTGKERNQGLTPGNGAVVIETDIGRIGAAICFDLNFESLRKQYAAARPQVIVFPSAYHGGLMQAVWAYECRAYFVSAHMHIDCGILDPFGRTVALSSEYDVVPTMAKVNLDYVMVHLDGNAPKFPDILRKYGEEVTVDVPAHVGSAMISSNSPSRSALDIAAEFDLELLDDYLARSIAENERTRAPQRG